MKFRNLLLTLAAALFCTASISAQLNHTWVSLNGSDSNPCTATSPCATFAVAYNTTNAGGIITAIDAGDFGAVTINQSVTIDGNNAGSISFGSGAGVEIDRGANVTLKNLTINGHDSASDGIIVTHGGIVTVQNCDITNFVDYGIIFQGAGYLTVENSRIQSSIGFRTPIGIDMYSDGAQNAVVRNTMIDVAPLSNSAIGLRVNANSGSVTASLQNVAIRGAGAGAVAAYSGVTEITGSVLAQSAYGVYAYGGATVSIASSQITANTTGVCSNAASKIRLDNNDIYDNPTAIGNCGGIVKTSTTNKTSGTIAILAADVSDSVTF